MTETTIYEEVRKDVVNLDKVRTQDVPECQVKFGWETI